MNTSVEPSQQPRPITVLGPPALIEGEAAGLYNDLLARVSGHLKPHDIFEEMWTREIVDLVWEAERWRQYLAKFLNSKLADQLESILPPLMRDTGRPDTSFMGKLTASPQRELEAYAGRKLVQQWASGDPEAADRVEELLTKGGMTLSRVMAQTMAHEIETVERFNRLIANAEGRRNGLLREIDRRRSLFAQRLRHEVQKIEQPTTIPGPQSQQIEHRETVKGPVLEPERRAA